MLSRTDSTDDRPSTQKWPVARYRCTQYPQRISSFVQTLAFVVKSGLLISSVSFDVCCLLYFFQVWTAANGSIGTTRLYTLQPQLLRTISGLAQPLMHKRPQKN